MQVVNRDELSAALRDVGATLGLKFRPYTATARAPFESYLSVMARTGVLVARHGPLLANAMFLPPGVPLLFGFSVVRSCDGMQHMPITYCGQASSRYPACTA